MVASNRKTVRSSFLGKQQQLKDRISFRKLIFIVLVFNYTIIMRPSFKITVIFTVIVSVLGVTGMGLLASFIVSQQDKFCANYSTTCNVTDNKWWYPIYVANFTTECKYSIKEIPSDFHGWFTMDCYYNSEQDDCPTSRCTLNEEEEKIINGFVYGILGIIGLWLFFFITGLTVYTYIEIKNDRKKKAEQHQKDMRARERRQRRKRADRIKAVQNEYIKENENSSSNSSSEENENSSADSSSDENENSSSNSNSEENENSSSNSNSEETEDSSVDSSERE